MKDPFELVNIQMDRNILISLSNCPMTYRVSSTDCSLMPPAKYFPGGVYHHPTLCTNLRTEEMHLDENCNIIRIVCSILPNKHKQSPA